MSKNQLPIFVQSLSIQIWSLLLGQTVCFQSLEQFYIGRTQKLAPLSLRFGITIYILYAQEVSPIFFVNCKSQWTDICGHTVQYSSQAKIKEIAPVHIKGSILVHLSTVIHYIKEDITSWKYSLCPTTADFNQADPSRDFFPEMEHMYFNYNLQNKGLYIIIH